MKLGQGAFGRINSLTWGNGLNLNRHFDQDGRLSQQQVSNAIQSLNFGYDNNSNILAITDLLTSANSGDYTYDAINRLKTETKGDIQNIFDYDPVGNRKTKTSQNNTTNTTQTLTYAIDSNRLATRDGSVIGYDNNGNTLQDGIKSWTYNARNRMSQFKLNSTVQADYVHNAIGERVIKKLSNETIAYFYNGAGQLLSEINYNNSGEQTGHTAYIWLGGMPLAVIKQSQNSGTVTNSQIAYIHSDHLNTPRIATGNTGQAIWQWQFTAFGEQVANEDVDGDGQLFALNLRFPGQYFDRESGLNYNYFRDYDPSTGRYVQSDPIGLAGGLNTYGYAYQSPTKYADPFGLDPYMGGRPLNNALGSLGVSHAYIATGADYPGDPNATITSFGQMNNGLMGPVDANTRGLSEGTLGQDRAHWDSLAANSCPASSPYASPIPADDNTVQNFADSLMPRWSYAIMGINSNAAASAVANRSSNTNVPMPRGIYPGANFRGSVRFGASP